MNPVRVFAKLAARVPPCDLQPGSTGAPEVDASTAAALCAGMPVHAYRAALARYSHDESVRQWLMVELWRAAIESAKRDRWQTAGQRVRRCANRAALELVASLSGAPLASLESALEATSGADYPRVVAEIILRETYEPGHWTGPHADLYRAAMLGVSRATYYSAWHRRAQAVGAIMDDWCGQAYGYMRRRQGGE